MADLKDMEENHKMEKQKKSQKQSMPEIENEIELDAKKSAMTNFQIGMKFYNIEDFLNARKYF